MAADYTAIFSSLYYQTHPSEIHQIRQQVEAYDAANGTTYLAYLNAGTINIEEAALLAGVPTQMPALNHLKRAYNLESAANRQTYKGLLDTLIGS